MSKLLQAFDSYNEFERTSFFTLSYNELSSILTLKTPLEESKENITKVIDLIGLNVNNYELVFKAWNTEDSSNADYSKDFPFQLLYKSTNTKCIIWITLENDTLDVEFLYDCKDAELEQWIIKTNHKLRQTFGLSKKSTFKVLIKSHSRFDTEDVRTENIELDIESNYNDDFKHTNATISEAIQSKQSGLILLHGVPGTGKTTYIKSLISNHSNLNFIFIQNEFVNNLLDPDFISFLLQQRNAILIIEDAEKVLTSREQSNQNSVVSTILQLTDGLFSDYLNIKVICTFNTSLSKIDTALMRKGRMIAMYEFKALSIEKANSLLSFLKLKKTDKALTISDIYNYTDVNYNNLERNKIGF